MWQRLTGGGGGGGDDSDSGSSSSSSSSSSSDSSTDDGGGGLFGGISDAVGGAADTVTDTVDDVTGGGGGGGGRGSGSSGSSRSSSSSGRRSDRSSGGSSSSSNDGGGGGGGPLGGLGDVTDDAMQGIEDTADQAQDTARDVSRDVQRDVNQTVDRAEDAANEVARDVDRTADRARRSVDRTVEQAEDTVDNTVDDVSSGARDIANDARSKAETAADEAQRAVDEARRGAGKAAEDAARKARDAAKDAAGAADDAARGVDRAVDDASRTVDDVSSGVSRSAGEVADATRDQVDHAADTYGEMGHELQQGDVGAAVDTAVESTGETTDNLARAGDAAAGSTDEYVGGAEINREVSDDLTRGGVLSETANDDSGLVPGFTYEPFGPDAPGLDLSEEGFRRAAESVDSVKDSFDKGPDFLGSPKAEAALQGAASAGVDLLNAPQHVLTAETGVEVATNAPGEIQEHGAGEVAETATGVGTAIGGAMAREASQNPIEFTSGTAFGFVTGAALGKAASRAGKAADAGRMRAGRTKVDMDEVTNPDTVDYYEGRNTNPENTFPEFDSQRGEAPEETLRRQGEEYTPDEVKQDLGPAAEDETYLTHMTDYDFDQSFEAGVPKSRPSDPDNAMFWGPEGSPNFAGFDPGESASSLSLSSLKPRLPRKSDFTADTSDALMSRMRVDSEPRSVGNEKSTGSSPMAPGDESRFLSEDADPGTAYVRNQNNRNQGEAEALVPGGSEFRELPESGDYYSELNGDIVNVRLFDPADADRRGPVDETGGVADADTGPGGPVDETGGFTPDAGGGEAKTYSEIVSESGRRSSPEGTPVLPTFTTGTEGTAGAASTSEPQSPGTYDGPIDDMSGFGSGTFSQPGESSGPSSTAQPGTYDGPIDETSGIGGTYTRPDGSSTSDSTGTYDGPIDESGGVSGNYGGSGDSSSPTGSGGPSTPPSGGPSTPFDEFGPTSPPSSPPSSTGPSGPTSSPPNSPPTSSPPSGGPSTPPGSPPPWSPPGSYGDGSSTSSPPGSPGSPGGSGGGFGPSPFDPTQQRRRDFDDERKKDEEDFAPPAYGEFAVDFSNPIASGASVLFGGFGGFGGGGGDATIDESGGFGFDEATQGGPFDESGGFVTGFDETMQGAPIDESGGLEDWTPF